MKNCIKPFMVHTFVHKCPKKTVCFDCKSRHTCDPQSIMPTHKKQIVAPTRGWGGRGDRG